MSHSSDWVRCSFEGGMRFLIELRVTGQLQLSKFTLKSLLLYTWRTNKSHQANQINRAGNTLFIITLIKTDVDWLKILYPVFRTERAKTVPCPAAHPRIDHIRDYPSPLPPGAATPLTNSTLATGKLRVSCFWNHSIIFIFYFFFLLYIKKGTFNNPYGKNAVVKKDTSS